MELRQKVSKAFDMLQRMTIPSTRQNVEAVTYALTVLQEVYNTMQESGDENGKD